MKNKISVMSLILLGIITFSNCSEDKTEIKSEEIIPVKVEKIIEEEFSLPIHTSGILKAEKEISLAFKTGGIISNIFVEEGEIVKEGQILAKLKLDEIDAQFNQAKINYEKVLRDFNRVENLYKDSVVTLEQYQNAKSGLEAASSGLNIAKFNLKYSTITAPFSGKIYKKFIDANEMVSPGTPIFIMGSKDSQWIIVCGITENDFHKIKIGNNAKIKFDSFEEEFSGEVTQIAGAANPMNGLFVIELSLKNSHKQFVSGMISSVDIYSSEKNNFKKIPIKSLVDTEGKTGNIFIIQNSKAVKKEIEIGEIFNEYVLVKIEDKSIHEIITDGAEYLKDGIKVKIVK